MGYFSSLGSGHSDLIRTKAMQPKIIVEGGIIVVAVSVFNELPFF